MRKTRHATAAGIAASVCGLAAMFGWNALFLWTSILIGVTLVGTCILCAGLLAVILFGRFPSAAHSTLPTKLIRRRSREAYS